MDAFKIVIAFLVLMAIGLTGCTSNDETSDETPDIELPDWAEYQDHVQQPLFDLVLHNLSPNHQAENAPETHVMVQVEIQLDPDSELPTGYLILEEGRAQLGESLIVQAYVRVDQLLDLSQEPEILYIRAPTRPRR